MRSNRAAWGNTRHTRKGLAHNLDIAMDGAAAAAGGRGLVNAKRAAMTLTTGKHAQWPANDTRWQMLVVVNVVVVSFVLMVHVWCWCVVYMLLLSLLWLVKLIESLPRILPGLDMGYVLQMILYRMRVVGYVLQLICYRMLATC